MTDLLTPLILTAAIILAYPLLSVYLVLLERKVLADFQVRLGPMRVGPHGLLQPLADALKLVLKEDIIPRDADKAIFWIAPVVATFSALTAFAVLPFSQKLYVADINVGLLFISAMGALAVLGIILGGWASNSHYSLLGALRASAQLVSYEVALSLALLGPVMAAGSLSMVEIVTSQQNRGIWFAFDNFGLMIVPFVIFMISAIAEVNRVPFDLPEAEAELVAGFHTEFSGFRWALYMLGESASTFVVCCVAATLFLGGWLRPFPNVHWLDIPLGYAAPAILITGPGVMSLRLALRLRKGAEKIGLIAFALLLIVIGLLLLAPMVNQAVSGPFWFFVKVVSLFYGMVWLRGTLPRFRYDQLMNIGWKILIPLGLAAIIVNAVVQILVLNETHLNR
jgi:NADH-quinone oxidoreductase subunit H